MTLPPLPPRRRGTVFLAAVTTLLAAGALACRADSPTGPRDGTTVRLTAVDATGDTIDNADATLERAQDLRQTAVRTKRDTLVFVLRFTRAVAAPTQRSANAVIGYIDLDVDQNASTGYVATSDLLGGTSGLGVEYFVDLVGTDGTTATVGHLESDSTYSPSGTATTRYAGDSVVVRLPASAIGNDDGNFAFSLAVGSYDGFTDFAPNSGAYTVGGGGLSGLGARARATVADGAPAPAARLLRRRLPAARR